MKVLVGAACAAVIAFVGYFFWGEWSRHERARVVAFQIQCDQQLQKTPEEIRNFSSGEAARFRTLSMQCLEFLRNGNLP